MLNVITVIVRKVFKVKADFVTVGGCGVRIKSSVEKNRTSFVVGLNIRLKNIFHGNQCCKFNSFWKRSTIAYQYTFYRVVRNVYLTVSSILLL
jgi:hypothetical protein